MDEIAWNRLSSLPVHDQVAHGLRAAEQTLGEFARKREVAAAAKTALSLAWRWVNGEDVSAQELYDSMHRFLPYTLESELEGRELIAHNAVYYALFYATWQAYGEELSLGTARSGILPNDICEGSEEVLVQCLDYAAQVATKEQR